MKISLLVLVSILLLLGGAAARVEASLDSRLIDAAEAGETAEVSKLLSAGASVNAHSPIGKTALMFAAQEGHPGVVETLLDNGAYIEAETSNGCKALYCAAGAGQLEVHRTTRPMRPGRRWCGYLLHPFLYSDYS